MLHVLLKKLMPRQDEFTELFGQQAEQLQMATDTLCLLLQGGDRAELGAKLGKHEKDADKVAEKIYHLLSASFSTPFRRGEIRALVGALDSIADHSEDVARRMDIYRLSKPLPDMAVLADCGKRCCALIAQAIPMLSNVSANAESINALCKSIHDIENQADDIHDNALRALYAESPSCAPELARAYEKIYDLIEEVVDACEDAANILGDIVAENA
jgi:uncharacterized protein Yka (UPF0111/DUF47 family)